MATFAVVTYNVLAQSFVRPDRYPQSAPEALDPVRRHALVLQRLDGLDADLLCLQELEPVLHDAVRARFEATHHIAYAPRDGRPDGIAILARRALFAWHGCEILAGPSLIAHLSIDDSPLHVACVHLLWQRESTPEAEHVGLKQMHRLLAHRDATAPGDTWLFAGDSNAVPQSAVLASVMAGGMAESCLRQRPWDTCAANGRPRKLDYLLYSESRLEPSPGILPPLTRDTVLPSPDEPSDHLPLRVEFRYPERPGV